MNNVKNLAIRQEERVVTKKFTEAELQEKKEKFIEGQLKLAALNNELNDIKLDYKTRMEPIKKQMGADINDIRNGSYSEMATVFLVDNQEEGKMEYYTEDGQMVYSRPLLPQEKQLHLIKGVL